MERFDVLIGGAGVIGLSLARALLLREPLLKVLVVEKESILGAHASGRNSGVLHAGFYYSPDSLKAKFCRDGNLAIREIARKHDIVVRDVGKVVVARDSDELSRLQTLLERGQANGVVLEQYEASELKKFEPLARTFGSFLWSPTTGVSDPKSIIKALNHEVGVLGAEVRMNSTLEILDGQVIALNGTAIQARHFINATGTQSDRIAHKYHVGHEYSMIPFMGLYRAVPENRLPLQHLVYPVPHPLNPFLGVHFTLTADHKVKIGPTAIPILGREQYGLLNGWSLNDSLNSLAGIRSMMRGGIHDLPAIIKSEWSKILTSTLVREATDLVPSTKSVRGWHRNPPGIRAQLVHLPSGKLEQDFIVRNGAKSTHILNAVSPGWTSSIPFSDWAVTEHVLPNL
ncbi:MAG: FAD-dependent oxidoreductase [Candidatus Nanopelagicaceae bacterium]|nr:FAD-dependent oxidoreductase [Candidatus Nanopelagicaceae bacterium]